MNLNARIKNAKNKSNYILNVNINIPIRPSNLQSYRPVSGQFTFSPSTKNKKLKLQVPSARTTYQCQSRKISYLDQTHNTMSYRNNRRKTTKSAFPSGQISQIINFNKKNKQSFRSQAVSPNAKKGVKRGKFSNVSGNKDKEKDKEKNNQFVQDLIDMSEDNIIGYTNQSSQLTKANKNIQFRGGIQKILNNKDKQDIKNVVFKVETPLLQEQRGLISGIRQFQKTAQLKKQHLNYQYLKQKVLILASVKKIQRAWRNYKTKKLIKSYSNNISLKFTGKMKNQFLTNYQNEQNKILTVRSCGYNSKNNEFGRKGKKNLSQLFPKQQQYIQQQYTLQNQQGQPIKPFRKKYTYKQYDKKYKEISNKSAVAKFQMQEIQKWQELIKQIRQGKKVQEVLQVSFKRKQQLQKSLSNNLKDTESNISSSQITDKSKLTNNYMGLKDKQIESLQQGLASSSSSHQYLQIHKYNTQSPNILSKQKKLKPLNIVKNDKNKIIKSQKQCQQQQQEQQQQQYQQQQQQYQQQGATTKRRRKKLQYFQNQIRKIDNQYSQSSNLSNSYKSQLQQLNLSPQNIKINNFNINQHQYQNSNIHTNINININKQKQKQKQENQKLKKKIQALSKIQLFNQFNQDKNQKQDDNQIIYLYNKLLNNIQKTQQNEQIKKDKQRQFLPISINNNIFIQNQEYIQANGGRLQTFRNQNYLQNRLALYEDLQNNWLKQLKQLKLSSSQKQQLAIKVQQQILFDLFLQFSQLNGVIAKMEKLYIQKNQQSKIQLQQSDKPEGICTNLQSIKDYLQNFVAYVFQQQPMKLIQGFNQPRGPSGMTLLKVLRLKQYLNELYAKKLVISQNLFDKHWQYASEQIYFDAKYPTDPAKEKQRVKYLKQITKIYFKSIFDAFNQCLQPYRIYGYSNKPYPWQPNIKKRVGFLNLQQIRPLIRLGYRKLSQIAVIYCGLLFQDKKHNMSQKMVQQIQKQRLDTLIQIQLQDQQYTWQIYNIQKAQTLFKISQSINQLLIIEICRQMHNFYPFRSIKQQDI